MSNNAMSEDASSESDSSDDGNYGELHRVPFGTAGAEVEYMAFRTVSGRSEPGNADFKICFHETGNVYRLHSALLPPGFEDRCTIDEDDHSQYVMEPLYGEIMEGEIIKVVLKFIYAPSQSGYLKAASRIIDCPFFHAYIVMLARDFGMPHLITAAQLEITNFFGRLQDSMLGKYSDKPGEDNEFLEELFEPPDAFQVVGASQQQYDYRGRDRPLAIKSGRKSPGLYESFVTAIEDGANIIILEAIGRIFAVPDTELKNKTTLRWLKLVDVDDHIFPDEEERCRFFLHWRAVAHAMALMWFG